MTDQQRASLLPNLPAWLPPLIDAVGIVAAFLLAYYVRYTLQWLRPVGEANRAPFDPFVGYTLLFAAWMIFSLQPRGLYRHVRGRTWGSEAVAIGNAATNALVVVMGVSFFLQPLVFSRLLLVYGAVFSVIFLAALRLIYRAIRAQLRQRGIGVERVLVLGAGEVGRAVMRNILARPDLGLQVVGFLDDDPDRSMSDIGRLRALGSFSNLLPVLEEEQVNLVIITLPWDRHTQILNIVRACEHRDVQVRVVPDLFQLNLSQVQVENLEGIPLLGVKAQVSIQSSGRILKRMMDIGVALLSAPFWLPLFGLIALAIRLEGPGPIFYRQSRIGQNGRPFQVWKFRSMVPNADALKAELIAAHGLDPRHPKIRNDPRVTKVGRIIRRLSLDELPQVLNILRGDMSLVGPRPPTPDEVQLYEPWHRQRLQIPGGLTGLWQVSGRSDVPFEEMVLLDLYYIENWSLLLDMQIILRTIPHVLFGRGAY